MNPPTSPLPAAALRRRTGRVLAVLLPLALAGCANYPAAAVAPPPPQRVATVALHSPTTDALDAALLAPPTEPFTLGPGDRFDIEFVGDPTSRTSVEVGPDGKIYFYLLPGIDVWGLTLPQARDLIAGESVRFLRKQPNLTLTLREVASKRVWLLGRLNQPGIFAMSGPMTLLEATAQAGGPTPAAETNGPGSVMADTADLRRSFVLRRGRVLPVDFRRLIQEGDLTQNIYLQPGDFVYLPSATARTVHVLGAVSLPGVVASGGDISLVQTIASAGGTIKDAHLTHVAIVRGSLSEPSVAIVDYRAILHGAASDVLLEPHDIVFVPYTPYRTLVRYLDLILQTFARTVGVNEGARAISGNAVAAGINVQVAP